MHFEVREFTDEDLSGVVKAFVEGFASRDKIVYRLSRFDPGLIEDVVRLFIEAGDLVLVAESEGKARGILVGDLSNSFRSEDLYRSLSIFASSSLKISDHRTIFSLFDGVMYAFQFSLHYTSVPSILLLTSQKGFREGIGTALMDRWIEEVKREGYDSTIVGTDERLNWRFYERYGFERNKTFKLRPRPISRPSEKIDGFIYKYDIISSNSF